jgi:hypothetical protein
LQVATRQANKARDQGGGAEITVQRTHGIPPEKDATQNDKPSYTFPES